VTLPSAPTSLPHRIAQTARLLRSPKALLRECADRYGDPFSLPTIKETYVVTGEPRWVKEIFAADAEIMHPPSGLVEPLVGTDSVVLARGERHRRKRKLQMPALHGARLRQYAGAVRDAARRAFADIPPSTAIDVLPRTHRLSLDIIADAVLGIGEADRISGFERAVSDVIEGFPAWLMLSPMFHRSFTALGLGPWSRYRRKLDTLLSLLSDEIERARSASNTRADVLSLLVGARDEEGEPLSEVELVDDLRTLIIAGHETTATTLAWALDALHRHPDSLARLREALAPLGANPDPLSFTENELLSATCCEALRMYPVVPFMGRRTAKDWDLAGARISRGTMVCPAVMLTHFHPGVYADPDAWIPDRFLARTPGPYEWYPFGGGSRRCLGAAFAMFELQVALGTIVTERRFSPVTDRANKAVVNGVTTRPMHRIVLVTEAI
jgi:cytochrome P450 family 110